MTNVNYVIATLGIDTIADDIIKHPKSGSDFSIRDLLNKFEDITKSDLINALELALSHLSEASNEISREDFIYIENTIKNNKNYQL